MKWEIVIMHGLRLYILPTSLSMFEVEVYYDASAYTSPTKTSRQHQYVPKIIG